MFSNNRYQTKGIKEHLPLEVQVILWKLIDRAKAEGKELDYLQVFEIEELEPDEGQGRISIKHSQEEPPREATYTLEIPEEIELVSAKIFVIDDGTHSTMLLASEY